MSGSFFKVQAFSHSTIRCPGGPSVPGMYEPKLFGAGSLELFFPFPACGKRGCELAKVLQINASHLSYGYYTSLGL